jgi:hypothetical protein
MSYIGYQFTRLWENGDYIHSDAVTTIGDIWSAEICMKAEDCSNRNKCFEGGHRHPTICSGEWKNIKAIF